MSGEWAGQNKGLRTDILKEMWGFKGLVMCDFIFGFRDSVQSLTSGLDVEALFAQQRLGIYRMDRRRGGLVWRM